MSANSASAARQSTVFAASYLGAIAMLGTNMQPVILGTLADAYGFSSREIGYLGAVFMGATTLAVATAPSWIRRANWRLVSMVALLLGSLVSLLSSAVTSLWLFAGVFCALGLIKGALNSPAFACLGDSPNPDRAYGISAVVQAISASAVVWPVSALVVPHYGSPGMFVVIAAVMASGLLFVKSLPAHGRPAPLEAGQIAPASGAPLLSAAAIPAYLMLLAGAVFNAGLSGFWMFVERIGVQMGVAPSMIGLALSIGSLASIVAAALFAWLSLRFSSLVFAAIGTACLLACFAVLTVPGTPSFFVANVMFSLGWGLTQPPYWAMLRQVDRTNRLFVVSPMASGLAAAAMGAISGVIVETFGFGGMTLFCAAACIFALVTAAAVIGSKRSLMAEPALAE